jgi:phosphotransferase system enzyme I (PtsI)
MSRLTFHALPISPGIAIASVFRFPQRPFQVAGGTLDPASAASELIRLEQACRDIRQEIAAVETAANSDGMTPLLTDHLFHGGIIDRIQCGMSVEDAVVQTTNDLLAIYGEMPDPVLRARGDNAEEVGRRLFRRLHGLPTPVPGTGSPIIIVTDEMTPFDASRLHPDMVAGVVAERGGATSHFAIIAKQLGIPVVSGIRDVLDTFRDGELCILDGASGKVFADPDPETLQSVRADLARQQEARTALACISRMKSATRDGKPVNLWGNIAGPADVQPILDAGGTGVGMFRTEFIFTGDEAPSEERQTFIYSDILSRTPGPVVMRTLEAGGDKEIPYLAAGPEENPNLGWQGLRMCLDMEELFLTQLRAMIRASCVGELWIMFPFVSALWEIRKCRELVAKAHAEVERRGGRPGAYKVGIMIEVPSAAIMAGEYLRDFDFCSIGTNDLTQFTLAADRMNPKVARWYDTFHPAVLRLIAMTASAACKAKKPIGMAGDMASNPLAIPVLIGLGFTSLSATAPRIPDVKKAILSIDSRRAKELTRRVLSISDTQAIRAFLEEEKEKAEES